MRSRSASVHRGPNLVGKIAGPPQEVHGADGSLTTYWVEFDEPQLDPDGDGPFARSRVLEKYLEAIDS